MGQGYAEKASAVGLSPAARRSIGVGLLFLGLLDLAAIHGVLVPWMHQARGQATPVSPLTLPSRPAVVPPAATPKPATAEPSSAPSPMAVAPIKAKPDPVAPAVAQPTSPSHSAEPAPNFPHLLFPRNTSWIPPAARDTLASVADLMTRRPELRAVLAGHTDDLGTNYQNSVLSLDRARRSRNFLAARGIDPNRIDIQGYGANKPIEEKQTPQARAQNRRVEITLR